MPGDSGAFFGRGALRYCQALACARQLFVECGELDLARLALAPGTGEPLRRAR
jgi:hypothetical protein